MGAESTVELTHCIMKIATTVVVNKSTQAYVHSNETRIPAENWPVLLLKWVSMIQARNFTGAHEDPELARTWKDIFAPLHCNYNPPQEAAELTCEHFGCF